MGVKEIAGNLGSIISNGKTEDQHKDAERDEWAEKDLGIAGREEKEREEHHHLINEWHEQSPPEEGIAAEADRLLEGLDDDLAEGDEHEHEHESDTDEGADDNALQDDTGGVCEPPTQMSQASDSGDGAPSADGDGDAPAAEPVQAAPAPKQEAKSDGGGEMPELAYWPALVAPKGEFTVAHDELAGMKVYAIAFQNAQKSAKKKALEAADVWVGARETTKHRSEEATKHVAATQQTVNSAGQSVASAQASTAKTDEGNTEQEKSKSSAKGEKQAVPSTGEKPGWTHPIKRFWWHLKTWAAEKTAAVMGWVQEKIASMVLAGICGVTMGQLKQYTEALHRRMDYSKGIGVSAIKKTDESKGKDEKNADFAHEQGNKALQDAAECDKNIADATTFMKDIEDTQKQVEEEKGRATTFMNDLHQQVKAERDKNPHGPVAPVPAAQSHTKARVANFATAAAIALVPGASMIARGGIAAGAMQKKKEPAASTKPLSPKAVARLKNAASFVGKKAGAVLLKLTQTREAQTKKFEEKYDGHRGVDQVEVGESVLNDAKEAVGRITEGMAEYQARTPQTAEDARAIAKAIRGNAESLDEFSVEANQSLNRAFKAAYEAADAA